MPGKFLSPRFGSRSGVGDYAETLRRALEPSGPFGVNLYHLGNNGLHTNIYKEALREPGVVVLHDAVLHHFLLGTLTREQYIAEFVYNYGEWQRDLGEELWAQRGSAGVDPRYFRFAMLRRVVEGARAVIAHNPGAAALAEAHGAGKIEIVPHFFEPTATPDHADTARFRERTGVAQGTALFGIFGYLRETKRVLPCIRAFRELHAARPNTALLLAGDAVSGDLRRLLETEARHPAIYRMGHLSERDLGVAAAAVDCCVNLRYPAAGETSGIAIRLMGIGKPVIVTAGAENADFPVAGCLRVGSGVGEAGELLGQMGLVVDFPGVAREVGEVGRRFILERCGLERCVGLYAGVLRAALTTYPPDYYRKRPD